MSNVSIDNFEAASVRVALLYGGWSREREISKKSADACRAGLLEAGFACVDAFDLNVDAFDREQAKFTYLYMKLVHVLRDGVASAIKVWLAFGHVAALA